MPRFKYSRILVPRLFSQIAGGVVFLIGVLGLSGLSVRQLGTALSLLLILIGAILIFLNRRGTKSIAAMSHELRTPLTVVQGSLANLKDGVVGPLSEKQARTVETAYRNIGRLGILIGDLFMDPTH